MTAEGPDRAPRPPTPSGAPLPRDARDVRSTSARAANPDETDADDIAAPRPQLCTAAIRAPAASGHPTRYPPERNHPSREDIAHTFDEPTHPPFSLLRVAVWVLAGRAGGAPGSAAGCAWRARRGVETPPLGSGAGRRGLPGASVPGCGCGVGVQRCGVVRGAAVPVAGWCSRQAGVPMPCGGWVGAKPGSPWRSSSERKGSITPRAEELCSRSYRHWSF